MSKKSYVKWARPYLNKKNAAAMTKKRAIKIIMAATCCGNCGAGILHPEIQKFCMSCGCAIREYDRRQKNECCSE